MAPKYYCSSLNLSFLDSVWHWSQLQRFIDKVIKKKVVEKDSQIGNYRPSVKK